MLLGTMAGISPGPLLALVINQSLKYGRGEGIKVAFSPLITDLPAILLTIFLISEITSNEEIFGYISFLGGSYVIYLGVESIINAGKEIKLSSAKSHSLQKGVLTNFLNPHPYMFWLSVGTPLLLKAYNLSFLSAALFIFSFYLTIIGSKIIIAFVADKSRSFLTGNTYVWTLRVLGALLIMLALFLIRDGWNYLN